MPRGRRPRRHPKRNPLSKKRFTSGLDSVFSADALHEPNIDASPWLTETSVARGGAAEARPKRRRAASRRPGKSFASDLDSLFAAASAVEAPRARRVVATAVPSPVQEPDADPTPRRSGVSGGLDALIRDTTNGAAIRRQEVEAAEAKSVRKRVTFTYDRDRFAKLKAIARQDGAYLKDVISGLLNDYIQRYERRQGPVEPAQA